MSHLIAVPVSPDPDSWGTVHTLNFADVRMRDLPGDLPGLLSFLRFIECSLADKATLLCDTLSQSDKIARETGLLLSLQDRAARKACAIPAACVAEVRLKLEIWQLVAGDADSTGGEDTGTALVNSVRRDLEFMA